MVGPSHSQRWDIFCRIVDNYGDIGVCWRLARQLQQEYGFRVRLWVDDLPVAQKLIPTIDPNLPTQFVDHIEIGNWEACFPDTVVADVVIEAFACDIPQTYVQSMVQTRPVWLNLEYLSAEAWVKDFHLKPSPHGSLPLTKYFYFPGFSPDAGGLLRERDLIETRDAFLRSKPDQQDFCSRFEIADHGTKVSLFCYSHAAVHDLLQDMADSTSAVHCLVTDGKAATLAEQYLGSSLTAGKPVTTGQLTLQRLPFLSQQDYDRLLWLCDLNFVRGEDSWLRGIWAGKPMIWQPYQQEEEAHIAKLDAFLACYGADLANEPRQSLETAHRAWGRGHWRRGAFAALRSHLDALQNYAKTQSQRFYKEPDLAAKLVIFCKNFF